MLRGMLDHVMAVVDPAPRRKPGQESQKLLNVGERTYDWPSFVDAAPRLCRHPNEFHRTDLKAEIQSPIQNTSFYDERVRFRVEQASPDNSSSIVECYLVGKPNSERCIILMTGWLRSSVGIEIEFLRHFANMGVLCILISPPYGVWRCGHNRPGVDFLSTDRLLSLTNMKRAVEEVSAIESYLRGDQERRILFLGVSIGGVVLSVCRKLLERNDICTIASGSPIMEILWTSLETRHLVKEIDQKGIDRDELASGWSIMDPSSIIGRVNKPFRSTHIGGRNDAVILHKYQRELCETMGSDQVIETSDGHYSLFLRRSFLKSNVLTLHGWLKDSSH